MISDLISCHGTQLKVYVNKCSCAMRPVNVYNPSSKLKVRTVLIIIRYLPYVRRRLLADALMDHISTVTCALEHYILVVSSFESPGFKPRCYFCSTAAFFKEGLAS